MRENNQYYVPRHLNEDEMCTIALKAMKIGQNCTFALLGAGTMIEFYKDKKYEDKERQDRPGTVRHR